MVEAKIHYVENSPTWESTHVFEIHAVSPFATVAPRPAAIDLLIEQVTAWCVENDLPGVEFLKGGLERQHYRSQYRNDYPDCFMMKDDRTAFAFKMRWC